MDDSVLMGVRCWSCGVADAPHAPVNGSSGLCPSCSPGKRRRGDVPKRRKVRGDVPIGICHYCHASAPRTRDHVVPKVKVRALGLAGDHPFHALNIVPSCPNCNSKKNASRSGCICERCDAAWSAYQELRGDS